MKLGKLSKKILITSVILSSIALVGCTTNNSTNKENNSSDNQITVQHKLGTTKLNSKPKKIAVLELSFLDSLHNLDIDPVAIADDGESNKVTDVTNGEKIDYVSVGDRKEPNLEELSSMDLDLIIADTSRHSEIYEDLNKIAPTIVLDSIDSSYDEYIENFETIAEIVGKEDVAKAKIEEAEKVLKNDAMALDIVKKELKKGSYVEVVAESSALPVSDLSTTDKTQLNEYLKDIEKDEDTEIGQYLDVSLAIYAKDSQNTSEKREIARLDETSLLLDFEIDLDEKFNDRGVTIYRLHENDDGSKTIDTLYTTKENGKVIFESHLFSEFIMVVDKEKTSEVKPSDSTKPDGNKPDGSENPNTDNPMNQDDKTSSSQVNTSDQTRSIELLLGCMGIVAVVYFVINMKKEETK